jgi:hypothetical protein
MTPLLLAALLAASAAQAVDPGETAHRCGDLVIPFPFHLNSSSLRGNASNNSFSFRLSCDANASLTLPLGATTFRVLGFFHPSGSLLLDYAPASPSACDAAYAAFSRLTSPAAALDAAPFLAVTPANVLRLYACEDSSLCRTGCDDVATCGGRKAGCCYPLSDGSVWKPGDELAVFSDFGCRGFSSWVKNRTAAAGAGAFLRGIEVEWAVPRDTAMAKCADGAALVNATAVHNGVRCVCPVGLVGDGFALGTGCSNGTRCKYMPCSSFLLSKVCVGLWSICQSSDLYAFFFVRSLQQRWTCKWRKGLLPGTILLQKVSRSGRYALTLTSHTFPV